MMTVEALKNEIIEELTTELKNEVGFDADLLAVKVKSAIREVKTARRYPSSYSEAMIEADLGKFFSQIKAVALYDFNKIGAEGQDNYSADGETIKYSDRDALFDGVLPLAGM